MKPKTLKDFDFGLYVEENLRQAVANWIKDRIAKCKVCNFTKNYRCEEHKFWMKKFDLIKDYIEAKNNEIAKFNNDINTKEYKQVNGRGLTNVGTFRQYIYNYLKNHPKIKQDMTLIVRQQQSTEKGLPIQIYCFTNDTRWAFYENIQSDIFDHIFSIVHEFDLKVFQKPSGKDLEFLKN